MDLRRGPFSFFMAALAKPPKPQAAPENYLLVLSEEPPVVSLFPPP